VRSPIPIVLTLAGVPDPLVGLKALVNGMQDFLFR